MPNNPENYAGLLELTTAGPQTFEFDINIHPLAFGPAWAIVEFMGNVKAGGLVRNVSFFGQRAVEFVTEVTDPDDPNGKPLTITQHYPPHAIYCISFVTQEVAKQLGGNDIRYRIGSANLFGRKADDVPF